MLVPDRQSCDARSYSRFSLISFANAMISKANEYDFSRVTFSSFIQNPKFKIRNSNIIHRDGE